MNDEVCTKERIIDLIASRIYDYFPCLESVQLAPHLFYARQNFLDSLPFFRSQHKVYRLIIKVGKKSREVFIKIRENAVSAQKEYEDTLRCWKAFSSEDFSISHPLDIIPEVNAVVFSKVDGISLNSLLRRAFLLGKYRFDGAHLTEYTLRAGKWLRAFHDTFGPRKSSIDVDMILFQIENWLNTSSARLEEKTIEIICRIARKMTKEDQLDDIKTSLLHTTFIPSHVFVYEQKITVIDLEKIRYGPVYYDLFNFTLSLDFMFKIFPSHVCDLKKSFFLGYFGDEQIPESTMRLFKIHRMAYKLRFPLLATFQNELAHRLHARIQINRALALLKEIKSNRTSNLFR